ncbi:FixH family protein [Bacillus manliponensis]|uniref:FixH family protein n=1 Tax=Bacillus manliponensis TaxID=574376 RepID=UPI00351668A3
MMKKLLMTAFIAVVAVAGCNTQKEEAKETKQEKKLEEVKVEVKTNPAELKPNEKVEVQAIVTQGKEKVTDASDVKFEIWKNGEENHEMLEGKHKGDGVYVVEKTFPADGVYHIIAHTNARDMHVMPEVKVAVGNAKLEDAKEEKAAHGEEHGDHGNAEGHGHHNSDTAIHFMAADVTANNETTLKAHVQHKEAGLTEANVKFEIWKDGAEKHEYVPAEEGTDGEYVSKHTFKEAGSYIVKVHVEKGELHEHIEEKVEVK